MNDKQLTWIAKVEDILAHNPALDEGETVALDEAHAKAWTRLYRESYATQFAFSQAEADEEWRVTLQGEYGAIWKEASPQFFVKGRLTGSLLTVFEAPWRDTPPGPFIIELMVDPALRRRGIATWLLAKAAEVCKKAQQDTLALRVMDTNSVAKRLYAKLGFKPWPGKPASPDYFSNSALV